MLNTTYLFKLEALMLKYYRGYNLVAEMNCLCVISVTKYLKLKLLILNKYLKNTCLVLIMEVEMTLSQMGEWTRMIKRLRRNDL